VITDRAEAVPAVKKLALLVVPLRAGEFPVRREGCSELIRAA
jgi:hypothetical protein